jgi:hypothetical protein
LLDDEQVARGNLRTLTPLRRLFGLVAVVALFSLAGNPVAQTQGDVCICATARATNGWCPVHEFGSIGGVKVTSRQLYEAADAHGHQVDLSTFVCPTCRSAIATGEFCDIHRVGFVGKLAYFSRLTYELARADVRSASSISCRICRKNAETSGWCAKSGVGMIGPFAIRNRHDFDLAAEALRVFKIANDAAPQCGYCAVAILTDTYCPVHRIAYRSGKIVPYVP